MGKSQDASDRLSYAHSKMQFLGWAIASSASSGELMGSTQQDGLAFILQDIEAAMKEALNYGFHETAAAVKVAKIV